MAKFILKAERSNLDLPFRSVSSSLEIIEHEALTALFGPSHHEMQALPEAGVVLDSVEGEIVWSGHHQALLFGRPENWVATNAIDVSDAWVFLDLKGQGSWAAMSRLAPIDLRQSEARAPQSFCTSIEQIPVLIIFRPNGFEIGVSASLARSLVNRIKAAMENVAIWHARTNLSG